MTDQPNPHEHLRRLEETISKLHDTLADTDQLARGTIRSRLLKLVSELDKKNSVVDETIIHDTPPVESTVDSPSPEDVHDATAIVGSNTTPYSSSPSSKSETERSHSASTFGDYEILSEIARGGMGVV